MCSRIHCSFGQRSIKSLQIFQLIPWLNAFMVLFMGYSFEILTFTTVFPSDFSCGEFSGFDLNWASGLVARHPRRRLIMHGKQQARQGANRLSCFIKLCGWLATKRRRRTVGCVVQRGWFLSFRWRFKYQTADCTSGSRPDQSAMDEDRGLSV